MLLSTGEQVSVALMAMAIHSLGHKAISLTGAQIGIITDSTHTKARIRSISTDRMREALDAGNIVIAAGFQGIDESNNITTLGRGGSDTNSRGFGGCAACRRLRNLHRRGRRLYDRPPASSPRPDRSSKSATTRCWNWPRPGPASCTTARSNSPKNLMCRSMCVAVLATIPAR